MKYVSFKNIFDFSFALVSIIVVAPLFILIFFTNLIILGKPIFFKQERPGYREKLFKIIKFRTMSNTNFSSTDFERMNSYGKWLRSTSLDELPELINILRGEMSFIGPRPLLKKYIPLYSIEQSKKVTLDRFLYAIGVRHIGIENAKILAEYTKTISNFFSFIKKK